jgi:hypothetical protein
MWIFYSGGLLMPSMAPLDKANPELTRDGEFSMQIRVREPEHLENLISDYLKPMGLEYSEIELTPKMDYNARLYMRPTDFGAAMAQMTVDIDYTKFKPTAERKNEDGTPRYKGGREYHSLLNSIWGTVANYRAPGGSWAPFRGKRSRLSRLFDDGHEDFAPDWDDRHRSFGIEDYVPASARYKEDLLAEVRGLPATEWDKVLWGSDLELISKEHKAALREERRAAKAWGRKAKAPAKSRKKV